MPVNHVMNKPAKKHHFVPQFYLRNFGNSLHGFDKTTRKIFETSPQNIAFEKDFHGPAIDGEHKLETALSQLEGRCQSVISNLIKTENMETLTKNMKLDIAGFVALQYIRTKETRERISDIMNAVINEVAKSLKIDDHSVKLNKNGQLGFHLNLFKDWPLYASIISKMKFIVVKNKTKVPFWTSDNPVSMQNEHDQYPFGNLGLVCKGIELQLPLTPTLALIICDPKLFGFRPNFMITHDEQVILRHNWLQIVCSTRFLYSNTGAYDMINEILDSDISYSDPNRNRVISGSEIQEQVRDTMFPLDQQAISSTLETWMRLDEYESLKSFHDQKTNSRKK